MTGNDLISRKSVIDLLYFFADEACSAIVGDIEKIPSVDAVKVVSAKWLPPRVGRYGCTCSNCMAQADNDYDYCPNCGARMEEGNSDENMRHDC